MRTSRWIIGWRLWVSSLVLWLSISLQGTATAQVPAQYPDPGNDHHDQPLALEAVVSYLPLYPQDIRIGAGLAFHPTKSWYLRADVIQHDIGLTIAHRMALFNTLEFSAGLSAYWDVVAGKVVPGVTLGRILF